MVLGRVKDHVDNNNVWSPIGSPQNVQRNDHSQEQQHWSNNNIDTSSVNAVSFGFVATAILISMFLLMAIFEKFLAPSSQPLFPNHRRRNLPATDESPMRKLGHPSPKTSVFTSWVSVLMPGDEIPTFIAHPAPVPCHPERISWPSHHHTTLHCSTSNIMPNINQV